MGTPFKVFGIDFQKAFVRTGEPLCPTGAFDDVVRFANFITAADADIVDVFLTIDQHPVDHIGHPGWWLTDSEEHPAPFTLVTPALLATGAIRAADPAKQEYAERYIGTLGGAMIWPVHCVPGTDSYELSNNLLAAVRSWENSGPGRIATMIKKGYHLDLESFGIFEPEFKIPGSILTDFNDNLLLSLLFGDLPIVIGGEARSHCVKRSVEQMVQRIQQYLLGFDLKKIVLLTDCMSDVAGFEEQGAKFLSDMGAAGCTLATTEDVLQGKVFG
jgi:nicotinamidase-related amidase